MFKEFHVFHSAHNTSFPVTRQHQEDPDGDN